MISCLPECLTANGCAQARLQQRHVATLLRAQESPGRRAVKDRQHHEDKGRRGLTELETALKASLSALFTSARPPRRCGGRRGRCASGSARTRRRRIRLTAILPLPKIPAGPSGYENL